MTKCKAESTTQLELITYPLMPFIRESTDSLVTNGIIRLVFYGAGLHCLKEPTYQLLALRVNLETRKKLNEVVANPIEYPVGQGLLKNVTNNNMTVWGPFNTHPDFERIDYLLRGSLKAIPILTSEKLVVVMQRSSIIIYAKLWNGVLNAKNILFFSTVFSVIVGTLFWLIERNANPVFKRPTGIGTGIYWSFVTMTTVGYGDVTPVTFVGRLLSLVWMVLGLMFASILTATLSESVTGVGGLQIEGREVAVLSKSFEYNTVMSDYHAIAIQYDSYDETIAALRKGKVYAAVLPYEVAAWMQVQISHEVPDESPLHMVYTLPGIVKFNIYITEKPLSTNHDNEEFFECLERDVVTKAAVDLHNRNVFLQSLYYGDLFSFKNNPTYSAMIGVLFGVIILGLLLTVVDFFKLRKVNHKSDEQDARKAKIEDTIRELNTLLNQFYEDGANKNNRDLRMAGMSKIETTY